MSLVGVRLQGLQLPCLAWFAVVESSCGALSNYLTGCPFGDQKPNSSPVRVLLLSTNEYCRGMQSTELI